MVILCYSDYSKKGGEKNMQICLVAAMAKNRVIGKNNDLPWHLPADMKHFREITAGKVVVMGRKTFEAIGKPLPNRVNIVISGNPLYDALATGCITTLSPDGALINCYALGHNEMMVIGGAQIYQEFLRVADIIYLTYIDAEIEGDAFFPEWNDNEWEEIKRESHTSDEKNKYPYAFVTLKRKILCSQNKQ